MREEGGEGDGEGEGEEGEGDDASLGKEAFAAAINFAWFTMLMPRACQCLSAESDGMAATSISFS